MDVIAFERSAQGTGASRRLRRAGKTPGIVYGTGEPQVIELDHNALFHALRKEAFHASILNLKVGDGASQQVLLRDVQYHPFKPLVLHVDFLRVDASRVLHTKVPVHYLNQEGSPAVKLSGGVITHVLYDLDIVCLPSALPEFVEVDLANFTIGQSVHAKEVKLPTGVTLAPAFAQENPVIVTATAPAAILSAEDAAADDSEAAPAA
ncbi:50S ribosomal protein L25/general stress protein Ctc [Robbsia sp. Bb-Pol-6]|uniref:Large ribosomal subunit protein bL25 n=1 Tax=Robbsia betulipollinis TaxID=2981849 RepID=A0ABT3ZKW4_9BURK|nr:50S ribosomal protein L25/general stress protein Ctc [Robbsia betulipollinis]MCY0387174.1 50S ribosomal protein L25/general stress protein Ctc [Robbsia betulipollinis]